MSQKPEPDTFYFFSLETTGIDMSVWAASHNRTDWIICPFHPQGWTCRWGGCCEPHSLWSWSLLLPKKQGKQRTDCAQQNCHSANRLAWICLLSPATTLSLRSNYKRVSREEGEDAEHLFTQSTYYQRLRWWTSSKMCACIFITFTKCVHTHTHTHTHSEGSKSMALPNCQIWEQSYNSEESCLIWGQRHGFKFLIRHFLLWHFLWHNFSAKWLNFI